MALADMFKTLGTGLNDEIKEFKSILGRIRLTAQTNALGANYRKFGTTFGTYDYDAFVEKAGFFFHDAKRMAADNPSYTIIDMADGRIAIDYNAEVRGIYTSKGKPLAFYRPDYRQWGYNNKDDELLAFKLGKNVPFS